MSLARKYLSNKPKVFVKLDLIVEPLGCILILCIYSLIYAVHTGNYFAREQIPISRCWQIYILSTPE
jgi:hypothetical protein